MTSPIERSIPDTPADKPEESIPPGNTPPSPRNPLDDLKDADIDVPGSFTRIIIPTVEFPSAVPPGGTKCE